MVDPINVTDYNRNESELQELLIFGLLVAGKTALTTSRMLDALLKDFNHIGDTPFEILSHFELETAPRLSVVLKDYGFGCYNNKAKGLYELVRSGLNLKTCTIDDLEKIRGIGMKTSRLFVLHTREDAMCIPLDVHMLHYLRDNGYDVPKVTPNSRKKYLIIERLCVQLARKDNKSCADWDLSIWNRYRARNIKFVEGGEKTYIAHLPLRMEIA
jgi:thermostable 8-oxoguanine DNA glycosylase